MCLTTTIKYNPTFDNLLKKAVKKAKKDIVCYKSFETHKGRLVTPYQNMAWPNTTKLVRVKQFTSSHEYKDLDDISPETGENVVLYINEGLHAYCQPTSHGFYEVQLEMIIPKGTPYILGEDGEIVALKMRLKSPYRINAGPKRKAATRSKRKLVKRK